MRVSRFSLPVIVVGFALTFLIAGDLSAKERGWYVHGGLSYWHDMQGWENESYFATFLPGFSTTGWTRDSSASQLSVGIGFNINKNWAIEVFSSGIPDEIIPGTHLLIPMVEPDDEPVSASWEVSLKGENFYGISVIYDLYVRERVSLFLKVGLGLSGNAKKLESTLTGSHRVLLAEQIPYRGQEHDTRTRVYAIGTRMPLFQYTKVSITFEYKFVRHAVRDYHRAAWAETSSGPEFITPYVSGKASTFEIGIQWRL